MYVQGKGGCDKRSNRVSAACESIVAKMLSLNMLWLWVGVVGVGSCGSTGDG